MKRNRQNRSCNLNCSKVGDSCNKNCSNSSTTNFAKNKSTITDNEYEVNSETNCTNNNNKRKRSK